MEYIRVAPDFDSDPDVEAAGWCAARVHGLLLKVSGLKDLRGRIPRQYQSPDWLAKRWNLTPRDLPGVTPEDFIANGVARLLSVGLVSEDDGEWVIRNWDKFYGPKAATSTARVHKHRNAVKRSETSETAPSVSPVSPVSETAPVSETPETLHHSTPPTSLNTTSLHEDKRAPPSHGPLVFAEPTKPVDSWDGDDWWAWWQYRRQESGYLPEKRRPNPRKVSAWLNEALMTPGVTPRAIREGFYRFGSNKHWETSDPPFPFQAFLADWSNYVRPEVANARAS